MTKLYFFGKRDNKKHGLFLVYGTILYRKKKHPPLQPPIHRCVVVAYQGPESDRWLDDAALR